MNKIEEKEVVQMEEDPSKVDDQNNDQNDAYSGDNDLNNDLNDDMNDANRGENDLNDD